MRPEDVQPRESTEVGAVPIASFALRVASSSQCTPSTGYVCFPSTALVTSASDRFVSILGKSRS